MIIYKIENKLNGKIYVGQTTQSLERRFAQHCCTNSYIGHAIRYYGVENFKVGVLEVCNSLDELNAGERFWIAFLNCKAPNGYNLTDGGEGTPGRRHSPATRAKLSRAQLGKKLSMQTRIKLSIARKGRRKSATMRAKLSATNKGHAPIAAIKARIGSRHTLETRQLLSRLATGRKHSAETRAKMSQSHKGHVVSDETRAKMSRSKLGHEVSAETRAKLSAAQVKHAVRCIETGEIFESIVAASRAYHLPKSSISNACKGRQKTSGKLHWEYVLSN